MNQPDEKLVVALAGGGTGGHLYPLLCVARALRWRRPGAKFVFMTTLREIDGRILDADDAFGDARRYRLPITPLSRSPLGWGVFARRWLASVQTCRGVFAQHRPSVVVGSGGFGSVPAVYAAKRGGVPVALLNPDAVPGRANRLLGRWADVVFAQWEMTCGGFRRGVTVETTGCPVRAGIGRVERAVGCRCFGLDERRRTLLVTGASQGSRSINEAVPRALAGVGFADWQVLHLTGGSDFETVRRRYTGSGLTVKVVSYSERMAEALAAADLVISRAGASTLGEVTAAGVGSILLPYPYHRDRHQYANAQVLLDAGAAVVLEDLVDAEKNGPRLRRVLEALIQSPQQMVELSRRAAAIGRLDAQARIAERLLQIVGCERDGRTATEVRDGFCSDSAVRDDARSVVDGSGGGEGWDAGGALVERSGVVSAGAPFGRREADAGAWFH